MFMNPNEIKELRLGNFMTWFNDALTMELPQ